MFSYRVAWRRMDGTRLSTSHYETWESAVGKYRRIKSLEVARAAGDLEGTSLDNMQPLLELRLEQRAVEPWRAAPYQPHVSERDMDGARDYAERLREQVRGPLVVRDETF